MWPPRYVEVRFMAQDDFDVKLGRIRDARRARAERHAALVFRQAGKHGARALRRPGHISPATPKRGLGAGLRAAAGLIAPGSREGDREGALHAHRRRRSCRRPRAREIHCA
jgi:hypothetical protein